MPSSRCAVCRPQAANGPDRDRDRARRRDGHRHVRPHRLDLGAFDAIFSEIYQRHRRDVTGKSAFDLERTADTTAPPFDESLLAKVRALPEVAGAIGGVGGEAHLVGRTARRSSSAARRTSASASIPTGRASTRSRSSTARGPGRARSWSTSPPRQEGPRGRPDDRRRGATGRSGRCASPGCEVRRRRRASAARRWPASTCRRRSGCSTSVGSSTRSASAAKPGVTPEQLVAEIRRSCRRGRRCGRRGAGDRGRGGHNELHLVPAEVPARVRRHRAVRRLRS